MNSQISQCCTFNVNGLLFGIDVLRVREIVDSQVLTEVPLSCPEISGLLNLRGEIVTSINLNKRFPVEDEAESDSNMHIVVITEEDPISLVVDDVGEVIEIDPNQVEEVPDTIESEVSKLVSSVYKLEDQLMLILDIETAVDVIDQLN